MKSATLMRVRSRLSRIAFTGKGLSVKDALQRADVALEAIRPDLLIALDDVLRCLDARFGAAATRGPEDSLEALYRLASAVIDTAIGLPDSDLDTAARSLCDLVGDCVESGREDWPAVQVHIETLKLLRQRGQAMSRTERQLLLTGLTDLRVRHQRRDD